MKNYGKMLTEQQAAREQDKGLAARQRAAREDQNREANLAKQSAFYADVLNSYVKAIEANVAPAPVRMPREIDALSGKFAEFGPDSPRHPFHDVFKDFASDVAGEFGLKFVFAQAHDGGGMESWLNVAMVPVQDGEPVVGPVGIDTLLVPHTITPVTAYVCVSPDGTLLMPSIQPSPEKSVRFGVAASLRGEPGDRFLEIKAKEGWRVVPIRIENAA